MTMIWNEFLECKQFHWSKRHTYGAQCRVPSVASNRKLTVASLTMSDKHSTNTESHAHPSHLSLGQPTNTFGGVHCLQLLEAPVKLLHSVNGYTLLVLICKGSFALGTQVLGGAEVR